MKKKIAGATIAVAGCLLAASISVTAQNNIQFNSKGKIVYKDKSGQEVVFDANDFNVLFQYAADSKVRLMNALSGIGALEKSGTTLNYDEYLQALKNSQNIPQSQIDHVEKATDDNVTLGRTGFVEGALILGNNHDLVMSYLQGWLEGSNRTDLEIFEENGQLGIRRK